MALFEEFCKSVSEQKPKPEFHFRISIDTSKIQAIQTLREYTRKSNRLIPRIVRFFSKSKRAVHEFLLDEYTYAANVAFCDAVMDEANRKAREV